MLISSDMTDPEGMVEQIDIESDDLADWREASERWGVELYIQSVCEERFGKLPGSLVSLLSDMR